MMRKVLRKFLFEIGYYSGCQMTPPTLINLNLTFRCNYQCLGCSSWKLEAGNELSDREWLDLADQLAADFPLTTFIDISGGEPLVMRTELTLAIIRRLKKHFQTVSLNSNGSFLDRALVRRLEEVGLDIIKISLYSLDREAHNFLRGVPAAYDHALAAIAAWDGSTIKLELGVLITRQSVAGIPALIEKFSGRPNIFFNLQSLDENYQSSGFFDLEHNHLDAALWPAPEETKKLFAWLYDHHSDRIRNNLGNLKLMEDYYLAPQSVLSLRCFCGQKNFSINPDGQVLLCLKRPPVGDSRKASVKHILRSAQARIARRNMRSCHKYCRIKGLNFSRGVKEVMMAHIQPHG